MEIHSSHPLAPLTTFGIGGPAHTLIEVHTEEDIPAALAHARESGLPLYVLGAGSNVLIPDAGVAGVVVRVLFRDTTFHDDGAHEVFVAGAGTPWEEVVDAAVARGLFGIENLAGIPGTMGGAAVQNIGAYGAELSEVFAYADVVDSTKGEERRIMPEEAAFAYRSSFFKSHPELVIVRVALRLAKRAPLNTTYADLALEAANGVSLATPLDVARAVRVIRARKFPDIAREGTAGSFFKNPVVSPERAAELGARFPGLPAFPQEDGRMKLSLAWILDQVLALKGYAKGPVRLYEKQPLVLVASPGATARDIDRLAEEVRERVLEETGIMIEREVETFGAR